jgi:hypothetical protein
LIAVAIAVAYGVAVAIERIVVAGVVRMVLGVLQLGLHQRELIGERMEITPRVTEFASNIANGKAEYVYLVCWTQDNNRCAESYIVFQTAKDKQTELLKTFSDCVIGVTALQTK